MAVVCSAIHIHLMIQPIASRRLTLQQTAVYLLISRHAAEVRFAGTASVLVEDLLLMSLTRIAVCNAKDRAGPVWDQMNLLALEVPLILRGNVTYSV